MTPSRPIPMSAESVRAILAGTKTQTRRVVHRDVVESIRDGDGASILHRSPYGQPGDRLWVREAFAVHGAAEPRVHAPGEGHPWGSPIYRASHGGMEPKCEGFTAWRSPLFMPRWASRLTLELTDVRVERVWEISEADAIAEGVQYNPKAPAALTNRTAFGKLWDKLNARRGYPWISNPWVWVLTFRRSEVA